MLAVSPLRASASLFALRISRSRKQLCMGLLIGAAAVYVYFPALRGGFVLDDDLLLTHNSTITASDGLYRFWFTKEAPDYWPVSNSTLWLEWRLWGMNPTGYHVTNLLLHVVDSLLFWLVLRKLSIPGAWLAALLFAVHPVNVESVAWIAQRKNVLALCFFLLSILCWLKAENHYFCNLTGARSRSTKMLVPDRWYWLSMLAFSLAMLSKSSVAILPLILLLIIWWQHGRIDGASVLRTAPFFLVSISLTVVNLQFQWQGVSAPIRDVTFLQRLLGAGAAVWFYLAKALLPLRLTLVYPQWNIVTSDLRWWLPLLATIATTAFLLWKCVSSPAKWGRTFLFAWAFFAMALLPAMGFVDAGYMRHSLVADHYQHIAIIGVLALVAALLASVWKKLQSTARVAIGISTCFLAFALIVLAHQQSQLFASSLALYEHAVENNPDSWLAHNNFGDALAQANRPQEAIVQFEQTLAIQPNSALAHNNLAMSLVTLGRVPAAINHYQQALRLKPKYPDAENNYALALAGANRFDEAQIHFAAALEYQPNFAEAHNNLGSLLLKMGRLEAAIEQFQLARKN